MDKKTIGIILGIIGFVVLAGGIFAGVFLVSKNQDIREKAAPATTLSLFPATQNKSAGENFVLTVNANSGENKITGIDIEVSFNPAVIQMNQMTATDSISKLSTVIKNGEINNTTGKARFVAFTASKDNAVSGSLDIITLSGTIISNAAQGASQVTFSESSTVAATDEGVNVIINSIPATITVVSSNGNSNVVSPTATATSASVINAPTNLSPDGNINAGQSNITWTGVSGATGYLLRVDDTTSGTSNGACGTNKGSSDVCETLSTTSFNYNFVSGKKYRIWVHAYLNTVDNFSNPITTNVVVQTSNATPTATPTLAPGGIGGGTNPTATATAKATATATNKPVATSVPVPVTGVSLPFVGGVTLGVGAILLSLFLAF